jgi:hypothetical protein
MADALHDEIGEVIERSFTNFQGDPIATATNQKGREFESLRSTLFFGTLIFRNV